MAWRPFRIAFTIFACTLVIAALLAVWFVHRALRYGETAHDGSGSDVEVVIDKGMSVGDVARRLDERGVIDNPKYFRILTMWEGKTTELHSGKYVIKDNLPPEQVLAVLIKPHVKEPSVKVTIPEGKNMLEVFDILEQAKVAKAADLEALARDKAFLARHAITGETVEGYLYPDTYELPLNAAPEKVLDRMISREQTMWNDLLAKHAREETKLEDKLKWTARDFLVMASIVEKEAVDPAERPRIAQVFMNRLTSPEFHPKRLETDPTIRYGCMVPLQKSAGCQGWDKKDRLHRAQLDDKDNPYNTYQHEGLPPGPISNPGRGSLEAVLTPDGSDYLYFVAKDARNHAFAKTLEEHQRNVEKYAH